MGIATSLLDFQERDFMQRVSRGEFIQVGKDKYGWPLYVAAESRLKPFKHATPGLSSVLHFIANYKPN